MNGQLLGRPKVRMPVKRLQTVARLPLQTMRARRVSVDGEPLVPMGSTIQDYLIRSHVSLYVASFRAITPL